MRCGVAQFDGADNAEQQSGQGRSIGQHRQRQRQVEHADDHQEGQAGTSGDVYEMEVPNASADAVFGDWHKTTFVNYLRIAFKWGGFPGWERYPNRPEKELAYLSEGLLPI